MGTKRLGLARVQALIENLKRDINLSNSNLLNGLLRKKAGSAGTQEDTTFVIGKGAMGTDGTAVDPYTESATQQFPLGAKLIYNDRTYRYAQVGGTGIGAGLAVCTRDKSHATNHLNLSCAAAAIGATTVAIETAGTDIVANEYKGGYLYVNDGTGQGLAYKIKSHPAHDHSDDATCVITLYDPIKVALVASGTSQVSLAHNKYKKVIVMPATTPLTGQTVGVTQIALTASYYGWIQTGGPAAALVVGTVVIGDSVCVGIDGGTAGSVVPRVADSAAQRVSRTVGQVMQVNASTEYALIDLMFEQINNGLLILGPLPFGWGLLFLKTSICQIFFAYNF